MVEGTLADRRDYSQPGAILGRRLDIEPDLRVVIALGTQEPAQQFLVLARAPPERRKRRDGLAAAGDQRRQVAEFVQEREALERRQVDVVAEFLRGRLRFVEFGGRFGAFIEPLPFVLDLGNGRKRRARVEGRRRKRRLLGGLSGLLGVSRDAIGDQDGGQARPELESEHCAGLA